MVGLFGDFEPAHSLETTKQKVADEHAWTVFRADRNLLPVDRLWAFTDGASSGRHGAVLISPGKKVMFLSRFLKAPMRNVGAELNAFLLALEHIPSESKVTFVFDYMGIGAWILGHYERKKEATQKMVGRAEDLLIEKGLMDTARFIHHGGHQRDDSDFTMWNTVADWLCSGDPFSLPRKTWVPWGEIEIPKIGLQQRDKTAREIIAEQSASRAARQTHWKVIAKLQQEFWYDWVDPDEAKVGQCMLGADGNWHQNPLGERPVILAYVGPRRSN